MSKKRYTEEQIISIIKESEAGTPVAELQLRHGFSAGSFYAWKKKIGGMEVSEAKCLRALEEENRRLKRLVADQALSIQMLEDVNSKKW